MQCDVQYLLRNGAYSCHSLRAALSQESPKAGGITWSDRIVGFIDGEQAPLDAVEASMDLLEASHMDINKGVPSGTAVGQVLGVSKVFPVAKHYWQLAIQKLHSLTPEFQQYLIQRQPQLIQQARHQGYTLSMQDLTDCMSEEDRNQVQVADSAATHLRPFVMLTAPGEIERRKHFAEARATALKQAAEEKEAAEFARLCHLEEKAIAKEHKAQIQVRKREMAAEDAATKAKLKDDNQNKCGSCRIRWSTEVECGSPWQECEDCKLWWCRVCRGCSCKGGGCKSRDCGGGHSTAWISHRDNCAK